VSVCVSACVCARKERDKITHVFKRRKIKI